METYGSGNAPTNSDFLRVIKEATDRGVIICNVTQCAKGTVTPAYETGLALKQAGVISCADMTTEAALTKLAILLGQGISKEKIASKLGESTRGELTSQTPKYSMADSKLVESFLDALRLDAEDGDGSEGQRDKEVRKEFQSIMLPMILCSTAGQGNVVNLAELLRYGANPNATDYDNRSPLHLACSEGHHDAAKILIGSGANVNACDRWMKTPLDDALNAHRSSYSNGLCDYLRENGAMTGDEVVSSGVLILSPIPRGPSPVLTKSRGIFPPADGKR
jgi:lysophospholipase